MRSKQAIDLSEYLGPGRSINIVFSLFDRRRRSAPGSFSATSTTSRINAFPRLQLLDPTAQRLHVIAAPGIRPAPRTDGRRFPALGGILVPGLQRGHAAPAVRPDPVVHRTNAHAKLFGGLLLLHAAQHQFDRLPSCLQRNYRFGHTASIPGIHRQPAFQALSGRIAQALHHLRGGHRRCEV